MLQLKMKRGVFYPQGNSNPRFLREKEMSWATRLWGQQHLNSVIIIV